MIGSSLARISSALADALEPDPAAPAEPADSGAPVASDDGAPAPGSVPAAGGPAPDVPRALIEVDGNDPPLVLDSVSRVIDLVWRRHLQAEARARMVRDHAAVDPARRVVGFADLVGFTALSQQIEPHELATVVERFELIAYDTVVSRGGRVVKMIGDEVMFAVEDERAAVEIALTLARTYREDDELNDVRVGLAAGPVLVREGDLFGPVVNRASRIVNIAFPGTVVCSPELRDALGDEPDLEWKSIGQRNLKDIGRLQLSVLRRAGEPGPPPSSREKAQLRRAERREAAVELIDRRNGERRRRGRRRDEAEPGPDVGPADPTP